MAFLLFAPMYWNPWMFMFPELYPSPARTALKRDEPQEGK